MVYFETQATWMSRTMGAPIRLRIWRDATVSTTHRFRDGCRGGEPRGSGRCSVDPTDPALGVCDVYPLDVAVEGERCFVVVVQRYR